MKINIPKVNIPKINISKNLIPGAIIIAAILLAGVYGYINRQNFNNLSSKEAADKTITFVNQNIAEGAVASLVQVTEKNDVYKINLTIAFNGAETAYETYITKDGKFLFPTGIDLEAAAAQEQTAEATTEPSSVETVTAPASFAQCLTEKGVKFYGAWWCAHCQNEKKTFGDAFQYVNYVECEQIPGTSQGSMTDACKAAKVESFPTWDFADGTRKTGELTLAQLADLSGCPLQ